MDFPVNDNILYKQHANSDSSQRSYRQSKYKNRPKKSCVCRCRASESYSGGRDRLGWSDAPPHFDSKRKAQLCVSGASLYANHGRGDADVSFGSRYYRYGRGRLCASNSPYPRRQRPKSRPKPSGSNYGNSSNEKQYWSSSCRDRRCGYDDCSSQESGNNKFNSRNMYHPNSYSACSRNIMAQSRMTNNSSNFVKASACLHSDRKANNVLLNKTQALLSSNLGKPPDTLKHLSLYRNPREFMEQNRVLLEEIQALLLSEQTAQQPFRHSKSPPVSESQCSNSDSITYTISHNNSVTEKDRSLLNNINRLLSSRIQSQCPSENRSSPESCVEMDSGLSSDNGLASCSSHSHCPDDEVTVLSPSVDFMINEIRDHGTERCSTKSSYNAVYQGEDGCESAHTIRHKSKLLRHYVLPINVRYIPRPSLQSESSLSTQKSISPTILESEVKKCVKSKINFSNELESQLRDANDSLLYKKSHKKNSRHNQLDENNLVEENVKGKCYRVKQTIRKSKYDGNCSSDNESSENIVRSNDTDELPQLFEHNNELGQQLRLDPEVMKNCNINTKRKQKKGSILLEEKSGGKRSRGKKSTSKIISNVNDNLSTSGGSSDCLGETYAVCDSVERLDYVINETKSQDNNLINKSLAEVNRLDQNIDTNQIRKRYCADELFQQYKPDNTDKSNKDFSENTHDKNVRNSSEAESSHAEFAGKRPHVELTGKCSLSELGGKCSLTEQSGKSSLSELAGVGIPFRGQMRRLSKLNEISTIDNQGYQNQRRKMLVIVLILLIIACVLLTYGFVSLRATKSPLEARNRNARSLQQQVDPNHDSSNLESIERGDTIDLKHASEDKLPFEASNRHDTIKSRKGCIKSHNHNREQDDYHAPPLEAFKRDETTETRNNYKSKKHDDYDRSSQETFNSDKSESQESYLKPLIHSPDKEDYEASRLDVRDDMIRRNSDLNRQPLSKEHYLKYTNKDAVIGRQQEELQTQHLADEFLKQKVEKHRVRHAEVLRSVIEDIMMGILELYDKTSGEKEKERNPNHPGHSKDLAHENDEERKPVKHDFLQRQSYQDETKKNTIQQNYENNNIIPDVDTERNSERTAPHPPESQNTKDSTNQYSDNVEKSDPIQDSISIEKDMNTYENDVQSNLKENPQMFQNSEKQKYDTVDEGKEGCFAVATAKHGGSTTKSKEKCGVIGMFFKKGCSGVAPSD